MRNKVLAIFLLLVSIILIQCKNDLTPNEEVASKLDGEWEVTRYHINGESKLGDPYLSIRLIFTKKGSSSGHAHIDFRGIFGDIIDYPDFFEVVSEGTILIIGNSTYTIDFENDELTLIGNSNDELIEIDAVKD